MSQTLTIIAGPCSISQEGIEDIYKIADIKLKNPENGAAEYPIVGTRVVGLKSRTVFQGSGQLMGMDATAFSKNSDIFFQGGSALDMVKVPSIEAAKKIHQDTGLLISSEIMIPELQLPLYGLHLGDGKFFPWSPAVVQLGWFVKSLKQYAAMHDWVIGIKNGKWLGDVSLETVQNQSKIAEVPETSFEKTWKGLLSYSDKNRSVLIHRGVDVLGKGAFRNAPVHELAKRVKQSTSSIMFFDPSHVFGPAMRDQIVQGTIDAMSIKMDDGSYLYDGILIEVGSSDTDTDQHLHIEELQRLCEELNEFRTIKFR